MNDINMIDGWIDHVGDTVWGWAVDRRNPTCPVQVDIFVNGRREASGTANLKRPDLAQFELGTDKFGFAVNVPDMSMAGLPIVFGKVGDSVIVPTVAARESLLTRHLQHPHLAYVPNRPSSLCHQPQAPLLETAFLARLCAAFQQTKTSKPEDLGPIWGGLVVERHREAAELASGNDPTALGRYLASLGKSNLSWGIFDGPEAHEAAQNSPEYNRQVSLHILDRLISLAEFLGCVPLDNPEQGPWGATARMTVDELLSRIADTLAIDITVPRYLGSYWGLDSRFGVFTSRMLECLQAAVRIKQILAVSGGSGVVELGGGTGLSALYARRLGIDRYTIIDLPTVALAQGFVLGEEPALRLHAEADSALVSLVAPWEYSAFPGIQSSDLLFNMDSFPEIETTAAISYLNGFEKLGLKLFLSINQESGNEVGGWSQGKVSTLTRTAGRYQLLSRHRSWMRRGYAEELYRIG